VKWGDNVRKAGIIVAIVFVLAAGAAVWAITSGNQESADSEAALAVKDETEKTASADIIPLSGKTLDNGMIEAASNEALVLYIHPETAEIAVLDRASGEMWHSNPQDLESAGQITPLYRSLLSSQLRLSYYNEKGQVSTFNSYDDSVAKGQFEIGLTEQGVKVTYVLGNVIKGLDVIPLMISEKRFQEEILNKIEDEETRQSIFYKFAFDKDRKVYTPRPMQPYVVEEVAGIFESIGYTSEDAAYDNKENGMESVSAAQTVSFTVSLIYSLEDDRLVVSVPADEIEYPEKFPILSLNVLEFFGAAGPDDKGYMFVPDGSGALIYLNNGKKTADPYRAAVYGDDLTAAREEKVQWNEPIRLPVFGMVNGGRAMMGVIEEGDAFASITADIGGRNHPYNYVAAQFDLMVSDKITLTSGAQTSSIPVFQPRIYQGDLKISYAFLSGKDASYVGMAKKYRERLIREYQWERLPEDSPLPFVLQLEGAFPKRQSFLGVPYRSLEPLTRYDEAAEIAKQLRQNGVGNIHLRYVGWFNNGIRHASPRSIDWISRLGGAGAFEELQRYAEANGIKLYPDVAFLRKYKGSSDAATLLTRKKAKVYEYHRVHYQLDKTRFLHYVLSPAALARTVDSFLAKYENIGVDGISLRDLGSDLNSDFRPESMIDRQQSLVLSKQETAKFAEALSDLMVAGGNIYAAAQADIVVEGPLASSKFGLFDEEVPFYSIVMHGYVDVAGQPWNLSPTDRRAQLLKTLETGAAVYYDWFYANPSAVKDTEYDYMYSSSYKDWMDEAAAMYREADEVLRQVRGHTIENHEKLADGVYRTTFDNGFGIIVNYNKEAVAIEGKRIEAKSFWAGVR
jgi:hypothetical protein